MGSEDLFKKRKAKKLEECQRKKAYRQPYERILIVCEGEKTEPFYFKSLCNKLSLHTANIEITGDCGSSPKSIFEKAQEIFKEAEKAQNPFDKVYCVFDKDCHHGYNDVINQINSKKPKDTFFAITSVPCFEYWLLLHFERTTSPFNTAAEVISRLKQFIPNYEKGDNNIFENVQQLIRVALYNAKYANEEARKNHTDNPSTFVLILVDKLLNLKS
ncbi:RloB family protein [Neisseria mucosa]|uniref:RloB family protein n=1 Tax=Neisseria mucosa TaxID=488 RepID=UPI00280A9F5E|nr:RloB family protein [Neisseria mucosa]